MDMSSVEGDRCMITLLSLPVACDGDEMEGIDYGGKTDRKPGWAVRVMCQGPSTKDVRNEWDRGGCGPEAKVVGHVT